MPTLDVTRRDIWLNKPRVAHRWYFHGAHKVHIRRIRLIAKLIYSGRSERADGICFPRGARPVLCIFIVSRAVPARIFAVRCAFLAFRCSTMQFVETDTIRTIYLPSIVTQASLSLARTNARPSARKTENGNGIRAVHRRHAVSVMYRAEKARYSQFIFSFSHATINRSHSRLWNTAVKRMFRMSRIIHTCIFDVITKSFIYFFFLFTRINEYFCMKRNWRSGTSIVTSLFNAICINLTCEMCVKPDKNKVNLLLRCSLFHYFE